MRSSALCSVKGCSRKIRNKRRQLCRGHYMRFLSGDINAEKPLIASHGFRYTSTYRSWLMMKNRCNNPKALDFKYYGGKGIKVCPRWKKFENFLADMGEKPCSELTLDRIDSQKGYSLKNCRWASRKVQGRNRNYCKLSIVKAGLIRRRYELGALVPELCRDFGVSKSTVFSVIRGLTW